MKEIKKISALFFISLLFLLISCEDGTNEIDGKKPADVKSIVITMIAKSSANPVFGSAKTGAIKTAKSLSEKYSKLDVSIDWQTPDNESASEQAEIIRNAVKNGTKAIIVSCSDEDTLTQAINYAPLGDPVPAGEYYMALWVDPNDSLRESNEINNGSLSWGTVEIGSGLGLRSSARRLYTPAVGEPTH